jgi:predicted transcriptional regulator
MRLHQHPKLALLFNSSSRAIFERLLQRPCTAQTLARELRLAPVEVAHRLCELVGAGLVAAQRSGERLVYRVDGDGIASLGGAVEQAWASALARSFSAAFQ